MWSALPADLRPSLETIALHGIEKNFPFLDKMTQEQFAESIIHIQPAARTLYQHWLSIRLAEQGVIASPHISGKLPERNDLCPCGSGKKFKKCCLH